MVNVPKIDPTEAESYQILSKKRIYGYSRLAFFNIKIWQYVPIFLLIVGIPILVFPRQQMVINHLKNKGMVKEALAVISESEMESSNDTALLLESAELYSQAGQPEKAIAVLENLLKKEPNNPQALVHLLELYEGTRNPEKRIATLEIKTKRNPQDAQALKSLADDYAYEGFLHKQTDTIVKLIRIEEKPFPEAIYFLEKNSEKSKQIIEDPMVQAVSRELRRLVEKRASVGDNPFLDALIRRVFTYRATVIGKIQMAGAPLFADEDTAVIRLFEFYVRTGMIEEGKIFAAELDKQWSQSARNRLRFTRVMRWNKQGRQALQWLTQLHREDSLCRDILSETATVALEQGDIQTAIFMYEKMIQREPEDPDLIYTLADLYFEAENLQNAFRLYKQIALSASTCGDLLEKILQIAGYTGNRSIAVEAATLSRNLCPDNTDILRKSAELLLVSGAEAEAVTAFEAYLKRVPEDAKAAYRLADLYLWTQQPHHAYRVLRQLAVTSGGARKPVLRMLRAASDAADREIIKEAVQTAVQFSPNDFQFQKKLASLLVGEGLNAEAIDIYRDYLKEKPGDSFAQTQLKTLYQWTGQTKKAVDLCAAASDKNPKNFQLALSAGAAFVDTGFVDAAIGYFQRALRIRPDHIPVRKKLATFYSWVGQTDKMVAQLEYLDNAGQIEAEQKRLLAQVYLDRKLWLKAIEQLKHWGNRSPLPVELGWMLAEAYIMTDQIPAATSIFMRIGSEHPKDPALLTKLGGELLGLGKRQSAFELFEAALSSDPDNLTAMKAIAQIYAQNNDSGSAIKHLEAYCRKVSDDYEAHYQLAELYFNKGRKHKAHKQYKTALALIKRSKQRSAKILQ